VQYRPHQRCVHLLIYEGTFPVSYVFHSIYSVVCGTGIMLVAVSVAVTQAAVKMMV
jgi:hypothetical protein